ncbi:hypothetical protein QO216_23270, partial [Vibrio vulnificus]|nr:hypothetical protein [Vibrio vulnificus]
AALGLGYQIVHYGEIPYVALTMGVFFTLYGFCKKKIAYDWSTNTPSATIINGLMKKPRLASITRSLVSAQVKVDQEIHISNA